jgi:hypothetical protein
MILDRTLSICCPSPCLSVQSSSIHDPLKSALRESRAGLSGDSPIGFASCKLESTREKQFASHSAHCVFASDPNTDELHR